MSITLITLTPQTPYRGITPKMSIWILKYFPLHAILFEYYNNFLQCPCGSKYANTAPIFLLQSWGLGHLCTWSRSNLNFAQISQTICLCCFGFCAASDVTSDFLLMRLSGRIKGSFCAKSSFSLKISCVILDSLIYGWSTWNKRRNWPQFSHLNCDDKWFQEFSAFEQNSF